jgi:hypothetical protein
LWAKQVYTNPSLSLKMPRLSHTLCATKHFRTCAIKES